MLAVRPPIPAHAGALAGAPHTPPAALGFMLGPAVPAQTLHTAGAPCGCGGVTGFESAWTLLIDVDTSQDDASPHAAATPKPPALHTPLPGAILDRHRALTRPAQDPYLGCP